MTAIRFSSSDHPKNERKAVLEEQHAALMGMDIESGGPEPMVDILGRILPNAGLATVRASSHIGRRTNTHVSDGNDDWGLLMPITGQFAITHKGRRQEIVTPGHVYLSAGDIPFKFVNETDFYSLVVSLPRQVLEPKLVSPDAALMKASRITGREEQGLLNNFVQMAIREGGDLSPAGADLTSAYIHDLAALLLNGGRDTAERARNRGLRAVRFHALKQFIKNNCRRSDLSLEAVAARHSISPHYVRKLFYDAGTSFSDYLQEVRLAAIYQYLGDPRYSHKSIGELAYDAGFNNLSWFNRAFKRRYHKTPSDIRADRT